MGAELTCPADWQPVWHQRTLHTASSRLIHATQTLDSGMQLILLVEYFFVFISGNIGFALVS